MKRNIPILGFAIGVLMPFLGLIIMYFLKARGLGFGEFLSELIRRPKEAATVLSLCLLAEIIPFIYYTNKRLDLTARGILIATILYAVFIVLLKFVWN